MTVDAVSIEQTPDIVDRDTWLNARLDHLAAEKAFTRQRDELSAQRRALPWVEVDASYSFDTGSGTKRLVDLFEGRSQLLMYHFMLGPGWDEGCPSCSFWADNFEGTAMHLAARDTTFAVVARAPLPEIDAYKTRMGWTFPWFSSHDSRFNFDMGVSFTAEDIESGSALQNHGTGPAFGEETAGFSVFTERDGRVYLSYQTFARGLDMLNGAYHLLDLTPKGRDEDDLDFTMAWLRRHDAY